MFTALLFFSITFNAVTGEKSIGEDVGSRRLQLQLEKGRCMLQANEPCYLNKKIKFFFYTGRHQKPELLNFPWKSNMTQNFSRPLKVLIHGYSSRKYLIGLLSEYLIEGKSNVLFVDWETLANRPCYLSATVNTWQVAKCTATTIGRYLLSASKIHIVGFSLGAHVAGHTSNYLLIHYGRKVDRITGLDPALPLYATPVDELKLDRNDAFFVDVVHTSSGLYGKVEPSGHQDFYINNPPIQPGCKNRTNPILCSHWRATHLFSESINISPTGFRAAACLTLWYYIVGYCSSLKSGKHIIMGEHANPGVTGVFVVRTRDSSPFALG